MPEVFLLLMFMAATLILGAGLMLVFRKWMMKRDAIMGGAPMPTKDHHGH